MRSEYTVIIKKNEGKRWLGIRWRRWEDKMKMGIKEIEHEGMNWIRVQQDEVRYHDLIVSRSLSYMGIPAPVVCSENLSHSRSFVFS
jgi:hypothetical protein